MATEPATETTLQDIGVRCPHCEYNLTGLTESRCPECGEPFDLEQLSRRASDRACPSTPWDQSPQHPMLLRFARTWRLAAANPKQLAREFPARHDAALALGYSLACYFFSVCIVNLGCAGMVALFRPRDAIAIVAFTFSSSVGAVAACWLCEAVMSVALALASPRRTPMDSYHFWRGLTHYTSGFTLMTAAWGAAALMPAILTSEFSRTQWGPLVIAWAWISALGIFTWWNGVLWSIIAARMKWGARCVVACVLTVLIGLGSILVGYVFAAICSVFAYGILRL